LGNAGDHHGFRVSTEGVFEKTGQFGVSVADELGVGGLFRVSQSVYAITEGKQALINISPLNHPLPSIITTLCSLRPSQVHDLQLCQKVGQTLTIFTSILSLNIKNEYGMRSTGHLIRPSSRHSPSLIPNSNDLIKLLSIFNFILSQILHHDALYWVFKYLQAVCT
jgi:hypothetical protein